MSRCQVLQKLWPFETHDDHDQFFLPYFMVRTPICEKRFWPAAAATRFKVELGELGSEGKTMENRCVLNRMGPMTPSQECANDSHDFRISNSISISIAMYRLSLAFTSIYHPSTFINFPQFPASISIKTHSHCCMVFMHFSYFFL